jgi:succinate dehydrogenase / fumarate reductase cytochrome b subunit
VNLKKSFWLSKLFSFLGIFPLGIYVVVHLFQNMKSLQGAAVFDSHLSETRSIPMIAVIAILLLWIPIAFHGLYGLWSLKKSSVNYVQFPYFGNLKYFFQRLSGIGLLFFIPAHIYKTRIDPGFFHSTLNFAHMSEGLSEYSTLTIYILGVSGVAYHLANGIWQFSIGWGITRSARAMSLMQLVSYFVFALILSMGFLSIWGFIQNQPLH